MDNNNDNDDIPNEFLCPITLEIMKEPYVMPDGQTYEKEAIRMALQVKPISPMTKVPMNFSDGVVNYSLKSLITSYLENRNGKNENKIESKSKSNIELYRKKDIEFETLLANYIPKKVTSFNDSIHIMLKPKPIERLIPICLFCVIDVSNSMTINSCQNVSSMEDIVFSRLNLVKHSLKTIVSTLRMGDMICLITFSSTAKVIFSPIVIDTNAKKKYLLKMVDNIIEETVTNLWAGLSKAFEELKKVSSKNYNKTILLFTDGESNINPPQGILSAIKDSLKSINDNFTISTFCYGNEANSHLLSEIAKLGNGIFGYCPDCTMVGTIFINFMANILSIVSPIAKIKIMSKKNKNSKKALKTYTIGPLYYGRSRNLLVKVLPQDLNDIYVQIEISDTQQTFNIEIGKDIPDIQKYIEEMKNLIQSQSLIESQDDLDDDDDMADEMDEEEEDENINENENESRNENDSDNDKKDENANNNTDENNKNKNDLSTKNIENDDELNTNEQIGNSENSMMIKIDESDNEAEERYEEVLINQIYRNKLVLLLNKLVKSETYSQKLHDEILDFVEILKSLEYKSKFISNIIVDIISDDPNHGQVEKAFREQYYSTWGRNYLESFIRFHQFEQCGNFKDSSLQYYGKSIFKKYRKIANRIFISLPPPKQPKLENTNVKYTNVATISMNNRNQNINNNVTLMRRFVNYSGGCFNGEATLLLENGERKRVLDLRKGDVLKNKAIVQCVVQQNIMYLLNSTMCEINGVFFSPYHPISIDKGKTWHFPIEFSPPQKVSFPSWFNLILKDNQNKKYEVEFENGCIGITLGHNRKENNVLYHPYFGTDLVINDIRKSDEEGYKKGYVHFKTVNLGIKRNGYSFDTLKIKKESFINKLSKEIYEFFDMW